MRASTLKTYAATTTSRCGPSSSAPTKASAFCVMGNRNGSSASSNEHSRVTSATALAALTASQQVLRASGASTSRASDTMSSERPRASSMSVVENSSHRAARRPPGLRAPLATARTCAPLSANSVRIRSFSLSLVLPSTKTSVRYVRAPAKAQPPLAYRLNHSLLHTTPQHRARSNPTQKCKPSDLQPPISARRGGGIAMCRRPGHIVPRAVLQPQEMPFPASPSRRSCLSTG